MSLTQSVKSLAALSLLLMGSSCVVSAEPVVATPAATGVLTVQYTVAGTTDPRECTDHAVDSLKLTIYDSRGRQFVNASAWCEDFVLSIDLPEGSYSADATLFDVNGRAASVTLALDALRIVAGTALTVDIDFPSGSLL